MTTNDRNTRQPRPGYRGTLTERDDRLAKTWLIIVAAIFVAILVLSALGIPSRFASEPTPSPVPSESASPSASESSSPSASESRSPSASESASPSASESGSPSASEAAESPSSSP